MQPNAAEISNDSSENDDNNKAHSKAVISACGLLIGMLFVAGSTHLAPKTVKATDMKANVPSLVDTTRVAKHHQSEPGVR